MKNNNGIIEGSEKWIERVPDEYAIKHVEAYISPVDSYMMILKFTYVKNCCRAYGSGFIKKTGILKTPHNIGELIEGIIILQNDISDQPQVYYKRKNNIDYIGYLTKCEIDNIVYQPLKFSNMIHYSGRLKEKQKSDENAPNWLKEFARERGANVAYFEF